MIFITDNENIVYVINKQTSKDPRLLGLLRTLVLICLKNNILFRALHIEGARNILTDSLSRLQVESQPHYRLSCYQRIGGFSNAAARSQFELHFTGYLPQALAAVPTIYNSGSHFSNLN